MDINLWKRAAVAGLVAIALAACSTKKQEGPVFATAEPLAAAKPDEFGFKQAIRVKNLEGLTETVRRNLTVILSPDDFVDSLRRSLANDQMLAPEDAKADYELTPYFVDLRTAAVSDRVTSALAIFHYRVVRVDDGTIIFDKRIKANFSSVADPDFNDGGMFNRSLEVLGFVKPKPVPVVAGGPQADETKGSGPTGETAREAHASRQAIALNVRDALRHLIVSSPERMIMPRTGTGAVTGAAPGLPPSPANDFTPAATDAAMQQAEEPPAMEPEPAAEPAAEPASEPLLPLAPALDDSGDEEEDEDDG